MSWSRKPRQQPTRSRQNQRNRRRRKPAHIRPTQRRYRKHSAVHKTSKISIDTRSGQQKISLPIRRYSKVLFVLLGVFFLGWLGIFGWLRDAPRYTNDSSERLQQASTSYMNEVTNFRLSLSPQSLERYLLSVLPEYSSIDVSVPLFDNSVEIAAKLHEPSYIWQAQGRQYGLTDDGFILNQHHQENAGLLTIIDNANLEYTIGSRVATEDFLTFMTQLDRALKQEELPANSLRIDGSTRYVVATLEELPFDLRLSPEITPEAQVATVKDILNQLNTGGEATPQDYIDTRIAGRAFWK